MSTDNVTVTDDEREVLRLVLHGERLNGAVSYGTVVAMLERGWITANHGPGRANYLLTYRGQAVARQLGIGGGV